MKEALEGDAPLEQAPGMKVLLVNELGYTEREMQIFKDGLTKQGAKVATEYGLPNPTISTVTFVGDYSKSPQHDKTMPTMYLTNRNTDYTQSRAQAWRWMVDGVPEVIARRQYKSFGRYTKTSTRTIIAPGTISALAHELSEMMVSPLLDNFTMPDSAGKSWRKEVCDPVLGSYFMEVVNGEKCIFPDFVLPSFWDADGKAPYSYMGSKVGPLVWRKGTYAWFRSAIVRLLRVQF